MPRLSAAPICEICWTEVPIPVEGACRICGDLPDSPDRKLCRTCALAPPPYERAVSAFHYRGRMRQAIHALKYDRISPAAKNLGRMLAGSIATLYGEAPKELLVIPVPLHRRRHAERGFNQTRLLARAALRSLKRTHPDWKLAFAPRALVRSRYTESQFSLTPRQRRQNVRGAFRVPSAEAVKGRHILLVDDILTTGATARAAALALQRAGAETVWVATLSRARRDVPVHTQPTEPLTGEPYTHDEAEPIRASGMFHLNSPSPD